ncbi:hypothetical protein GGX14DRAFT_608291 [Mycena pura]|uniref:Uncharacterized protein n=1 Tax=Mycena pura TaxID=153505 RepID=A0AAD6VP34_9AGAR|nr:hypothetical protein GGX14DRAFT_608291 [Mycena pura]
MSISLDSLQVLAHQDQKEEQQSSSNAATKSGITFCGVTKSGQSFFGVTKSADAIRARRANGTLLDLDGVLSNAPLFAQEQSGLFGVIRSNNTLPPAMRELIVRGPSIDVFRLQHEPVARMAGLTTEQLLVVRLAPPFFASQGLDFTPILGPDLVAAMTFADWITENVHVPDTVFDALRPFLNDSQLVEATSY